MGLIQAIPHGLWDLVGYALCLAVGLLGYETLVVVLPIVFAVSAFLWRLHILPSDQEWWLVAAAFMAFLSLLQYAACLALSLVPWLLLHADRTDGALPTWNIPFRSRDASQSPETPRSMGSWDDPSERKPPGGV